jgi:cytochrome P450
MTFPTPNHDEDLVMPTGNAALAAAPFIGNFHKTLPHDAYGEVDVAGVRIEPGQKVAVLLGAANRDPAVFTEPDRFDVARTPNPHLAFGAGIHFCLGGPLARVELQATLDAVRRLIPDAIVAARPCRRQEFVIRGLHELQLARGG